MPKQEDTFMPRYLKARAMTHESRCRLAATYLCNPFSPILAFPCLLRKCRRVRLCTGPMRPSAHLADRQFALAKIGFESHAPTTLPSCMAGADAGSLKQFEEFKEELHDWWSKLPDQEWPEVAKVLKLIQWCDEMHFEPTDEEAAPQDRNTPETGLGIP